MTASEALKLFAEFIDERRPSAVQLEFGNRDFNKGAIHALEWMAKEARRMADDMEKLNRGR